MNLSNGFQIEQPAIYVPWGTTEARLRELFLDRNLRHVTSGYYVTECVSLGGLTHMLGFHFRHNWLAELEFFSTGKTLETSFRDFQAHLEMVLGTATSCRPGSEGFSDCEWCLPGATVTHLIRERFRPEEKLRISPSMP